MRTFVVVSMILFWFLAWVSDSESKSVNYTDVDQVKVIRGFRCSPMMEFRDFESGRKIFLSLANIAEINQKGFKKHYQGDGKWKNVKGHWRITTGLGNQYYVDSPKGKITDKCRMFGIIEMEAKFNGESK